MIVKHNNPCGAAVGGTLADAYGRAFESDTVSAFGGIVAFNREADEASGPRDGRRLHRGRRGARLHRGRAGGVRRAQEPARGPGPAARAAEDSTSASLPGGALVQDRDRVSERREDMEVVSDREPTEEEWRDLLFAWTVAMRVKSNAIVFARDLATVGVGAGQMSRVDSSFLAVRKAGDRAKGAVMASDAFFPFPDAVEVAADAGVTAVIHPGGSIRDDDVLAVAESRGMAVVVTGRRHFRH